MVSAEQLAASVNFGALSKAKELKKDMVHFSRISYIDWVLIYFYQELISSIKLFSSKMLGAY